MSAGVLAVMDVRAMQVRYFELMRTRIFMDLAYVPTEQEASKLYVREEGGKHYPSMAVRCCPTPEAQAEMLALESAIEAAGVRMYL